MKKICFTLFVFMILGSCSLLQGPMEYNENNQVIIIEEADTEAPEPQGELTIDKIERTIYLKISWEQAKDNITAPSKLQYKLIRHTATMSIENAEEMGELIMDWKEGISSYTDKTLEQNTEYYYALLVKDEAGYKSLYPVKSFTTSGWKYAGQRGFSSGEAQYISLALSSNDTPYVAYQDVATSKKITVKKLQGNTWIDVGNAGFSTGEVDCVSLIVIGSTPYVSFIDNGYTGKIVVKKYNGTSWEDVGGWTVVNISADYPKIATNGTDLYVAFRDNTIGKILSVMKYDSNDDKWKYVGTKWVFENAIESAAIDIKVSSTGIPFVAYVDNSNSKITVKKFNGSSWQVVGEEGFSEGIVDFLSLALYSFGYPVVVYRDNSKNSEAVVKSLDEYNIWKTLGSDSGISNGDVYYPVIAINHQDTPFVAYHNASGMPRKPTVLRHNGSSWDVYGYANYHPNMWEMSLAISSTGKVYTAFQDGDKGDQVSVMYFD